MEGSVFPENLKVSDEKVGKGNWKKGTLTVLAKKLDPDQFSTQVPLFKKFIIERTHVLRQLHHPNLVTILDLVFSSDGEIEIVREYVIGSDLSENIERDDLKLADRLLIAKQIASAMKFLHKHNLHHHNLKPTNVLLQGSKPENTKLCDVGFWNTATQYGLSNSESARWTAPEPLLKKPYEDQSDVFSFGLLLWCLVAKQKKPPNRKKKQEYKFEKKAFTNEIVTENSSVWELIVSCCNVSDNKRPNFEFIEKELKDILDTLNKGKEKRRKGKKGSRKGKKRR